MGLLAFKHEFEEVIALLPAAPTSAKPVQELDNALAVFDSGVKTYRDSIQFWQSKMAVSLARLEDLFSRAAKDEDPVVLGYLIDNVATQILDVLDRRIDELQEWVDSPARKFMLDPKSPLASHARKIVEHMEAQSFNAVVFHINTINSIRDNLKILIWDHDPEARGGPVFDNVNDLISSLHK